MLDTRSVLADIPPSARALTVFGELTSQAVLELFTSPQRSLFPPDDAPEFVELADALRKRRWEDAEVALFVQEYGRITAAGRKLDIGAIVRWVLGHHGKEKAQAVFECMEVEAPEEIDILRVLSRKGSQKIVFLASWRLRQQEVVLKQIIGTGENVDRIVSREMQPHPLTMVHPNIIETHFLRNRHGEIFLVERKLPIVLSDRWSAGGLNEAANLLYDIANALKFLHDNSMVHGDIKPDNIGKRGDHYVLLDFGICRPIAEFARESTPTGSLRTRAPELLANGGYVDPTKADIWALAATVFNAIAGHFPLFSPSEMDHIPRVSEPEERARFEAMLNQRATKEWSRYVVFDSVPAPLQPILRDMLVSDPALRLTAADVVSRAEKELSAFLRSQSPSANPIGRFSPMDEFRQIAEYLSISGATELLPPNRKQQLTSRLGELRAVPGFESDTLDAINQLLRQLA